MTRCHRRVTRRSAAAVRCARPSSLRRTPVGAAAPVPTAPAPVDRRPLGDIRAVGDALARADDLATAAADLGVDEPVLRERLRRLHPSERAFLRRLLSA